MAFRACQASNPCEIKSKLNEITPHGVVISEVRKIMTSATGVNDMPELITASFDTLILAMLTSLVLYELVDVVLPRAAAKLRAE
jgi:hypothetical protein